jgi:cell pole-organizing protein PopZ
MIRCGGGFARAALRLWGTAMAQSAKAQEPSMEEILASIRRIIADDDPPSAAAPKPEPVAPAPPLRAVASPAGPAAASSEDLLAPMAAPPREPPPATADQARRSLAQGIEGGLLSSEASAAVDTAFSALVHTVLVQNARTLEDLVREMLRPMLKSWLDDNLPSMVERIVRAEIERVSRGRA